MHILFLTHYFPPEVNAPASRTYENAKRWVRAGHRVTVLTCVPNHPRGRVYPGYENELLQWDEKDRIKILRVITYLSANEGFVRRTANYVSYMLFAALLSPVVRDVDIVVSTSPQFFCGMAGFFVSRLKRVPWVLEIRDLWPDSIISVDAMRHEGIIASLRRLESFMYRKADHIVCLSNSFKQHIEQRGKSADHITFIPNGADLEMFKPGSANPSFLADHGLNSKFIVSYVGTHGMAHALETVLRAAERLRSVHGIQFLLVGDGAERERLLKKKERMRLTNVAMLPQLPKEKMPAVLFHSGACMVLLKKDDLFKMVIPSKIFEVMAMERPIILGVEGECKNIIEEAGCGLCIEPENDEQLASAALSLFRTRKEAERLGMNGRLFVKANYDRDRLAQRYLDTLKRVLDERSSSIKLSEGFSRTN
jgi:glycosyltransferase involved in cell wall biosynthesis